MELKNVILYRITHIENISHILKFGITHKNSPNRNPEYINIGDISLIDTRSKRTVNVDNGESQPTECDSVKLGEFIPFYFGVKMPMLYVAQHGGNFVEQATQPDDIIYLACSLSKIVSSGMKYYFSDGHATDMLTSFYDKSKINELINIIDWQAIKTSYWGGTENLNIKRKKQAEFLISEDLPPEFIIGFGCNTIKTKNRLIQMGIAEEKIKVIPNAYY